MCDYDGNWEQISCKTVLTRKAQTCGGCDQTYPARSIMTKHVGKYDGDFSSSYGCQACEFMRDESLDTGPLHLCWHDLIHGDAAFPNAQQRHDYVRMCLEEGHEPLLAVAQLLADGFLEEEEVPA
jgi:hypothetical protein